MAESMEEEKTAESKEKWKEDEYIICDRCGRGLPVRDIAGKCVECKRVICDKCLGSRCCICDVFYAKIMFYGLRKRINIIVNVTFLKKRGGASLLPLLMEHLSSLKLMCSEISETMF